MTYDLFLPTPDPAEGDEDDAPSWRRLRYPADRTIEKRVVMFSGGLSSWATARRVVERHGTGGVVLLFADTLMEDADLYRFLDDAAADVGVPVTRIADGRTPWEVFFDEGFLGNSRVDPCSKILKRKLIDAWLKENCDPARTVCYVGIGHEEMHRYDDEKGGGVRNRAADRGWVYEAPMLERPWKTSDMLRAMAAERGVAIPRLYGLGFAHNNCGGFCVKAGQAQFVHLLRTDRELYLRHEAKEEEFRERFGDHSMMTDRRGDGKKKPLTMRALRERYDRDGTYDMFDTSTGCGCFVDEAA